MLYDAAVLVVAWRTGDRVLRRLLGFAAVSSVWMVVPDAFRAEALATLDLPPAGCPTSGR